MSTPWFEINSIDKGNVIKPATQDRMPQMLQYRQTSLNPLLQKKQPKENISQKPFMTCRRYQPNKTTPKRGRNAHD